MLHDRRGSDHAAQPGGKDRAGRAEDSILGGDKVRFIILMGQPSLGRMKPDSDIDINVYYDADDVEGFQFRLKVLSDLFDDIYDIKIFQQPPLPLRMEVLKGKVLYEDGTAFMYDKAYETIK